MCTLWWLAAGWLCAQGAGSTPAAQVRVAVEACLAGLFARREAWPLTELRSLLHNWTSRELDAALAALARDGQLVVEGGMVRPA